MAKKISHKIGSIIKKSVNLIIILQKSVLFFILFVLLLGSLPTSSISQSHENWTNLGLYGGQIYAIAIDHMNPDKMFASSWNGDGLFMTLDGGSTWKPVDTGGETPEEKFINQDVWSVKIAPSDNQVVWSIYGLWAAKSTDGGLTWAHILDSAMQNEYRVCFSIAIDPSDSQTVYIGTTGAGVNLFSGAVYKTVDGGITWQNMNQGDEFDHPVKDIAIDPQNRNIIWAGTSSMGAGGWSGTLYRSEDGGESWAAISSPNPGGFLSVAVKPNDSTIVFAGSMFSLTKYYFDGSEWQSAQPVTELVMNAADLVFDPQNPDTLYAIWVEPIDIGVFEGTGKVGRSSDGGDTWEIYAHDYVYMSLAVHPMNSEIIFTGDTYNGVMKSVNHGQTLIPINNGLSAAVIWDVKIDPDDSSHILAGAMSGLYEKKGDGEWSRLRTEWTSSIAFHSTNSSIFYAGIKSYLVKTVDGGQNWTLSNLIDVSDGYCLVSDIAIDPNDTNTIFIAVRGVETTGTGAIYKSTDGGDNFTRVLDGINQDNEVFTFNVVKIDPSDSQHIYAGGGCFFQPGTYGNLYESKDGGESWTLTGLQYTIVNALLIDPQDSNILYAGIDAMGDPVMKSMDGGATWSESFEGARLEDPWNSVTDLEFYKGDRNIIYAATFSQGVFISLNQAKNWLMLELPKYEILAIATSSLYAATQGALLQCTGTGVIAGSITDAASGNDIDDAIILSDFGVTSRSINGNYMMISPAGITSVTAIADGRSNKTVENVEVYGGDVCWTNIKMESGVPNTDLDSELSGKSGSKDGPYCFITSINSRLAFQGRIGIGIAFIILSILFLKRAFFRKKKRQHATKKTGTLLISIFTLLAVIAFLLCTSDLYAAGTLWGQVGIASSPNPVGSGARAMGMGGAFIAIADDATAASWNPSGLIQLEKPELSMVVDYNSRTEDFSSNDHPEIDNTGEVHGNDLNYFSAARPFKFYRNMVVAINYQRLYDFNRDFDYRLNYASAGLDLQQDKNYGQEGFVGAAGIAAAIEITPRVSVGLTVNVWTEQLFWNNGWEEKFNEQSTGSLSGVPVTYDTNIKDKYSHFRGVNANFGVLWDIYNNITIGAVFKTPFTASLYHEFDYTQTQTFGPPVDSTITSDYSFSEDAELHMPMSYGLGLAWRFSDEFTIDFDIYRTHWSDYIFEDEKGNKFSPIDGRPKGNSEVQDTTQIRLGGEYLIIKEDKGIVIPARCGLFYDPAPSEGSAEDFYGFAFGSGIAYKHLIFDAAYQYRWGKNVDTGNLIQTSKADITQHTFLISLIYHF